MHGYTAGFSGPPGRVPAKRPAARPVPRAPAARAPRKPPAGRAAPCPHCGNPVALTPPANAAETLALANTQGNMPGMAGPPDMGGAA